MMKDAQRRASMGENVFIYKNGVYAKVDANKLPPLDCIGSTTDVLRGHRLTDQERFIMLCQEEARLDFLRESFERVIKEMRDAKGGEKHEKDSDTICPGI